MNKNRLSQLLYVGFVLVLTACQGAGQSSKVMFRPGNAIAGMNLTTGARDAAPLWAFCSPAQYAGNTTTADCRVPIVSRLAIGYILMPENDAMSKLDWSEISWELTIDGQPIDLNSFGTYDFVMPALSHNSSSVREIFVQFTAWDVVLTNLSPGEHTIHGLAQMGTDSYKWVFRLTIQTTDGIEASSIP